MNQVVNFHVPQPKLSVFEKLKNDHEGRSVKWNTDRKPPWTTTVHPDENSLKIRFWLLKRDSTSFYFIYHSYNIQEPSRSSPNIHPQIQENQKED